MTPEALRERLAPLLSVEGPSLPARDPVNAAMIRHWCDAVDDRNPVYTDPDAAAKSVHGGLVAPPAMLQAWTMPGLRPPGQARIGGPTGEVLRLLDEAGYTSVVATNCHQEYRRYLVPGDLLHVTAAIASVSEEKRTALGVGRFVSQVMVYRDQRGEEVARMTFRLLKFRPPATSVATDAAPAAAPRRPRPARSRDNAFFWEGVDAGELRIQRCGGCGRLRHPPGPMCPACHDLDWDSVLAIGRGHVYSFVVAHHPAIPPFDYPNAIVLVELEEGTRLVSNLVGVDPAEVRIGTPVEVVFREVEPGLTLPLFRTRPEDAQRRR